VVCAGHQAEAVWRGASAGGSGARGSHNRTASRLSFGGGGIAAVANFKSLIFFRNANARQKRVTIVVICCRAKMKKRILLVDDEQDVLDLLKYNLEAEGYEIMTATDTLRAFELAQNGPDLIILEAMLPNSEDGWAFICKLRQTENTKSIPIICLTAETDEKGVPCETACEVNDYLTKPISMQNLLSHVKAVL
jgi:CheY-like chemotaxis protein